MDEPDLILAAHPTRGVDVRSSRMIRDTIKAAARRAAGVLLVSSEMQELLDLSDRILVLLRGGVVGEFRRDAEGKFDVVRIGQLMTGAAHREEVSGG
jgi:simple sugar transport system ATP-binding protein